MKAIRFLNIINFQSHKHSELEFSPGLNVITGPSDSGKTAIIRALRWALYNWPQGQGFIHVGQERCRVDVAFTDSHEIYRIRGKKQNEYVIYHAQRDDRQKFEGFGTGVPLEVIEASGMPEADFGVFRAPVNFAFQLDGPFLLTLPASHAAKVLGKLAGTEEIDVASKTLHTDLYRRGQDEKRLERELAELEAQIRKYDHLPVLERAINELEPTLEAVQKNLATWNRLAILRQSLAKVKASLEKVQAAYEHYDKIARTADPLVQRAEASMSVLSSLKWRANDLRQIEAGKAAARNTLDRTTGAGDAETHLARAVEGAARRERLARLKAAFIALETGLRDAKGIVAATVGLPEAVQLIETLQAAALKRDGLLSRRGTLVQLGRTAADTQAKLARLQEASEAGETVESILTAVNRREKLVALARRRQETRGALEAAVLNQQAWNREAELAAQEYVNVLVQAGRCPVCGSEVDPIKLKEVV